MKVWYPKKVNLLGLLDFFPQDQHSSVRRSVRIAIRDYDNLLGEKQERGLEVTPDEKTWPSFVAYLKAHPSTAFLFLVLPANFAAPRPAARPPNNPPYRDHLLKSVADL